MKLWLYHAIIAQSSSSSSSLRCYWLSSLFLSLSGHPLCLGKKSPKVLSTLVLINSEGSSAIVTNSNSQSIPQRSLKASLIYTTNTFYPFIRFASLDPFSKTCWISSKTDPIKIYLSYSPGLWSCRMKKACYKISTFLYTLKTAVGVP